MIIFVQSPGTYVGKSSETITISKIGETKQKISIREIEGVIVRTKAQISYDAIILLSEYSIPVIFQRGGKVLSYITPFANHGFVFTRRAQLNAYNDYRGVEIAKIIVAGSLDNKARLLKYYAKGRSKNDSELVDSLNSAAESLRSIRKKVLDIISSDNVSKNYDEIKSVDETKSNIVANNYNNAKFNQVPIERLREHILGLEGEGARIYFEQFRKLCPLVFEFNGRNRRPPKDPINSMLSYGYTLLQGEILAAVAICGLEPYAGYLHSDRSGKPSLILDLIEEFRQVIVDRIVLKLVNLRKITPEDFEKEGAFIKLKDNARKIFIDAIYNELKGKTHEVEGRKMVFQQIIVYQSRKLVRYLLGKEDSYAPFKFIY